MRMPRNLLIAGAAVGVLAIAGTAAAQEQAMRTIQVPANAVVLVLPGASGMQPGVVRATGPIRAGVAPGFDALFRRMDAQMQAIMQAAERSFALPGTFAPERTFQAALGRLAPGSAAGVVVTSFSDGRHRCTQRVTYTGNGAAPVIRTSGDGCALLPRGPVPALAPETGSLRARSPLVQAMTRQPATAQPMTIASLGD